MIKFKTKVILTAILGVLFASDIIAIPYGTGYRVITFVDASRANRQIETLIYYPSDVSGFEVPLAAPNDKKFPVVVFGHDEATGWNNYQYLWDGLVPKGFMVAIPLTEMWPVMDVTEYAKDLAFVASSFVSMRYDPASFFFKRHNSKSCVMGHGYGGSAATLAVQYNPAITALISLAAIETAPGVIAAASQITIPSVIISGGEDCVAPAISNQIPMYNALASDCKTYIDLLYASHCNFAMGNGACTSTEVLCNGSPVTFTSTNQLTNYLAVSFLRYYMKYNSPALPRFEWKLQRKTTELTYIFDCGNINARVASEEFEVEELVSDVKLYPNPVAAGNSYTLVIPSEEASSASIVITDLQGKITFSKTVDLMDEINEVSLSTNNLSKGYYMVTIRSVDGKISKPFIIE